MIAFLPIARYRVEYQVASGRPFSSFERLLLKAVKRGHSSVDTLAQMFAVHRRLVVEALVTLMQAGWVSLGIGEAEFVLSPSGEKACEGDGLPPTIAVSDRQLTVIVEKVTGQVARNGEVDFYTRGHLKALWEAGIPLLKGDVSNIIDQASISPLLPHQPTEWIRWIGPITVLSDNAAFAVVDVERGPGRTGRVTGIPRSWEALLLPECLSQLSRWEQRAIAAPTDINNQELRQLVRRDLDQVAEEELSERDMLWEPIHIATNGVLSSSDDHRAALETMIVNAVSYVAICCPELAESAITNLLPLIVKALDRELLVNIFLGALPQKNDDGAWGAFELLKKLAYDTARKSRPGRLALGTRGTECWTSIALADSSEGVTAIFGSYSWGSRPLADSHFHISVRFSDAWATARLCELLAGFASADERLRLEAGVVRLKKATGELRQRAQAIFKAAEQTPDLEARVLLGRDHQQAIGSIVSAAEKKILVYTDSLIALALCGWLRLLLEPSLRLGAQMSIFYTAPDKPDSNETPVLEALLKNGVVFERKRNIDTTLIVVDESKVVLTNARSISTSARQFDTARVGVLIRTTRPGFNLPFSLRLTMP